MTKEIPAVTVVNAVWRNLVGTVLMVAGLLWLGWEVKTGSTHGGHIFIATGLAVFGALIVVPDGLKIIVALAPYLPLPGGRRAGDLPQLPKDGPERGDETGG